MSLMICLKYTKLSAEVLFGKMRLKYNFPSFTIHCEMSVIKKNCHVHELLSRQYSLPISENISTSSGILNSRTLSPKLGHVNENLNENCSWFVLVEVLKFDSDPGLFTVYMHKKITFSKDF